MNTLSLSHYKNKKLRGKRPLGNRGSSKSKAIHTDRESV